jgi:hypothetical protein
MRKYIPEAKYKDLGIHYPSEYLVAAVEIALHKKEKKPTL